MIHPLQEKLLDLARKKNLAQLSLREMAALVGVSKTSPQQIKHHLVQLQKKGFLSIDRAKGVMKLASNNLGWSKNSIGIKSSLFSIPIIGTANCGPATIFAEHNFQGFLRVSSKLIQKNKPDNLYAIKADGSSMNRAEVKGRKIDDGDYVIVDNSDLDVHNRDVVVAIIDGKATIKRFIDDRLNGQIVLKADSSFDYEPIYLHPDDDFSISGKVISVIKKPATV